MDIAQAALPQAFVSSADIVRQFGRWQDHAAKEPVVVTHHGRGRIVLVSTDHYRELTAGHLSSGATVESDRASLAEQLMEHVVDGFIAFRPDMTICAINGAACGFLKGQRDVLLNRRLDEFLPGIEDTIGYASLLRAARSGSAMTIEMPSFAYEGRRLLFQTFPFGDGPACMFRDITDEHEARVVADAKTATLAAMSVHAGIGRARLSPRGTFAKVEQEFARMVGFAPEGLARARLTDILATRDRSLATDAVDAVLEGGDARALDVAILTKSGAERNVRIGLAPLRSPGEAIGAVVVMTDTPAGGSAARLPPSS